MSSPRAPKVSVIIPCYNHARFLPRRIKSILEQDYEDFELICLDDCSTDQSLKLLHELCPEGTSIISNEFNSGSPFVQWERGLSYAQGEYVWIAESDDFASPNFLSTLVAVLDEHEDVVLTYCQSKIVDESDREIGVFKSRVSQRRWEKSYTNEGLKECLEALSYQCTIPNASAAVFRRRLVNLEPALSAELLLAGDWITWVDLLLKGRVHFHARALNFFRVSNEATQRGKLNQPEFLFHETKMVNDYLSFKLRERGIDERDILKRRRNAFLYLATRVLKNRVSSLPTFLREFSYLSTLLGKHMRSPAISFFLFLSRCVFTRGYPFRSD